MFLEEEVYGMLNWGFAVIMLLQFILIVGLWIKYKSQTRAFLYIFIYLVLFSFAGYNLLVSIHTFEGATSMSSEDASLTIAMAALFWVLSVLFLFLGVNRFARERN